MRIKQLELVIKKKTKKKKNFFFYLFINYFQSIAPKKHNLNNIPGDIINKKSLRLIIIIL